MYKFLIRPFLFLFSPETAHHITFFLLKSLSFLPFYSFFIRKLYQVENEPIELFGITFPGRVGLAAGLDKSATAYNQLKDFGFSHIEIGTITPKAQTGNPKPRLFRIKKDKALINRMGFNSIGAVKTKKRLKRNKPKVIIGANIGKNTKTLNQNAAADYVNCLTQLFDVVDYFVINVSCPNIVGLTELQNKENVEKIVKSLQEINNSHKIPKPLLLKISPDLTKRQLDDIIYIVKAFSIAGLVATNTTVSRQKLSITKNEIEKIGNGGLSGFPLKEKSTETIRYLHKKLGYKYPIIGVGGILTTEDALEKINAGASMVQIYTGFVYEGPALVKKINQRLKQDNNNN